jgi:hypothetical protein
MKRAALAVTLALLFSGCGAGSLPGAEPPHLNAAGATGSSRHLSGRVRLTLRIPRRVHRHVAKYVSPATASVVVTVFNAAHTVALTQATINTAPGTAGCSSVSNGTFDCTLAVAAPIGPASFDVDAFDAPGATGNKLSAASGFPFTILKGKPNAIAMTLGGIPATIQVALTGNSPFAFGDATAGFQLGGNGSGAVQQLAVTAQDADGYTIVDPGAPSFTLTANAPTKLSIAAVAGMPGRFNLTPLVQTNALQVPNPSTAIALTAKAAPASGTSANAVVAVVNVQNDPIVYATNYGTAGTQAYAPWSSTPVFTIPIPNPAQYPTSPTVALDAAGNVYTGDYDGGTITEYSPGNAVASRTISQLNEPGQGSGLNPAIDAAGDIFVTEYTAAAKGYVEEFTPGGGNTPSRTLSAASSPAGINQANGIAVDTSGNLYVANYGGAIGVSVFAPGASLVPTFTMQTGMSGPVSVAFDASGNLYVTNYTGDDVTKYKPPFSNASVVAATFGSSATVSGPLAAIADGAGNVYVADYGNSNVIEFAPGAPTVATRTLTSSSSYAYSIALDRLDNLYVPWLSVSGPINVYAPGASTTPFDGWTAGVNPDIVAVWQ